MSGEMQGKICLITGATNGIGKAAAQALAAMGAVVMIAGRSAAKTQAVVDELRTTTGNHDLHAVVADLSLASGVHALANDFQRRFSRLDVLLNNAGSIFNRRTLTAEGIEMTFALNHLNYFLLTHRLLDILKGSGQARIINVSSDAHRSTTRLDFDNLQGEKRYIGFAAYSASKLANVLFTYELARRLAGSDVTVNALHPGAVSTGFGLNNQDLLGQLMFRAFQMFTMPAEQGAQTSIYLASSPQVQGVTGQYFVKCRAVRSSPYSYDEAAQKRLWEISEQLVAQPS